MGPVLLRVLSRRGKLRGCICNSSWLQQLLGLPDMPERMILLDKFFSLLPTHKLSAFPYIMPFLTPF